MRKIYYCANITYNNDVNNHVKMFQKKTFKRFADKHRTVLSELNNIYAESEQELLENLEIVLKQLILKCKNKNSEKCLSLKANLKALRQEELFFTLKYY